MNESKPSNIDAAIAQIDLTKWGAKASVVCLVRLSTVGDPTMPAGTAVHLPYRHVAEFVGLRSERWVQRLLEELVAEKVLIRVDGSGARSHAYMINLDVWDWEVPWRGDRLGSLVKIDYVTRPLTQCSRTQAVMTRYSASLGRIMTRSHRVTNRALDALPPRQEADLCDALPPRQEPAPPQLAGNYFSTSLTAEERRDDVEETNCQTEATFNRLRGMVYEKTRGYLIGAPLEALRALASSPDTERLVNAAAGAPPGITAPALVALLQGVAHAPAAGPPPAPRRLELGDDGLARWIEELPDDR